MTTQSIQPTGPSYSTTTSCPDCSPKLDLPGITQFHLASNTCYRQTLFLHFISCYGWTNTPKPKLAEQLAHNNSTCRMLFSLQTNNQSLLPNFVKIQALQTWCAYALITRRMANADKSLPTVPSQSHAAQSKHVLHGFLHFSMTMPHLKLSYVLTNHTLRHHSCM